MIEIAKKAGVDVGEVYEVDASRRTTAANAYVNGLGHTKRVVLYDTLLKDFTPAETRLVVAHELGHVRYKDVPHGLLWLALVAPFATLVVARLGEKLTKRDATPVPADPARARDHRARASPRSATSSHARSSAARTRSRWRSPTSPTRW